MQTLEEARRFAIAAVGMNRGYQTIVRAGLGWVRKTSDHVSDKKKTDKQRS